MTSLYKDGVVLAHTSYIFCQRVLFQSEEINPFLERQQMQW